MALANGHLLTTGTAADPLLPKLVHAINHATEVDICVSFAQKSGVLLLFEPLAEALANGATVRIMTSDYLFITHPHALRLFLLLKQHGAEVRLYRCTERKAFHLKSYIFVRELNNKLEAGTAFVGSSNLSESALTSGFEWNLRFDVEPASKVSREEFTHIRRSFEELFHVEQALDLTWQRVKQYADRYEEVTKQNAPLIQVLGVEDEPEPERYVPNEAQTEALIALQESRAAGYKRGLVVMGTGMGKTWLAAFDAQQLEAKRVLFVAHREEILLQAQKTFSALFPKQSVGFYNGSARETDTDFVFASVQSIGRLQHLQKFAREHFDYVVVDEFHHAASRSYQKLLNYFKPSFLLGLTATPERTDQSDILGLCDHNLVFERTLVDGISNQILVPFHYFGIYDEFVDYQEIPWRSGKFDPTALETAFATTKRAKHIYEHWREHRQTRTLGFCVSRKHADFMADYFCQKGVRAVAVYSGAVMRRNEALKQLAAGEIEVIFSVDLFNEGTDIPEVDTVLMARPTESKILFLQQLGRGLRKSLQTQKSHVVVLDFIGNHKSFLVKPASLLGTISFAETLKVARNRSDIVLPDGCLLNFDLEILDFWSDLAKQIGANYEEDYESLALELGQRPSATQFYRAGFYHKAKIRQRFGGWLGLVAECEAEPAYKTLFKKHGEFMRMGIEQTAMVKCFKAILLQAFVELDGFSHAEAEGIAISELAQRSWEILYRYPEAVLRDLAERERALSADSKTWLAYWKKNPVNALTTPNKGEASAWFSEIDGTMKANFSISDDERDLFESMVLELCELRIAEYLAR